MLFALIFPRAHRASTYDISAERNVWLQSALRSFAIVCDYMETGLFAIVCDLRSAIVCDPRSSAIVCDHMETSLKSLAIGLPASRVGAYLRRSDSVRVYWTTLNHSHHNMFICGLSLHHGNTESCKNLEQKFIKSSSNKLYHVFTTTVETNTTCWTISKFQYQDMQVNENPCLQKLETKQGD